jgi:hypothetical protein
LEALEVIKRETSRLEELTLDEARGRILVIREIEGACEFKWRLWWNE